MSETGADSNENGYVIMNWSFDDFVVKTFPVFRDLKRRGLDLTVPIQAFASSADVKYSEVKYSFFLQALEYLRLMNAKVQGIDLIISKKQFDDMREHLRRTIGQTLNDAEQSKRIIEKLPELQRNTFMDTFTKLCQCYAVEFEDLFPPGQITLKDFRNKFVHASGKLDPDELFREKERLQAIVERIILKMLKWNDLSMSPDPAKAAWLSKN